MSIDRIHIALSLNDNKGNYSKYTAAAIVSVLKNTEAKVLVHLLTDDSVSQEKRERFVELVNNYDQEIVFYDVAIEEDLSVLNGLKRVTAASLYRLRLPDILDDSVERVIYLDSDIIVNLDIEELWDIPFDGKAMIAVKDPYAKLAVAGELGDQKILNSENYYNAGVMVWNLDKIRKKYDIYNQAMVFFRLYGKYCNGFTDQHASNYIFSGDVKYVSNRYNVFTVDLRGKGTEISSVIYHFSGDKPDMLLEEPFDQLFIENVLLTPWGNSKEIVQYFSRVIKARNYYIDNLKKVLKQIRRKRIAFWGVGSIYFQKIIEMIDIDCDKDYCIDSNPKYWNSTMDGMKVYSAEWFEKNARKDTFVIVISKRYFDDISAKLDELGMAKGIDYIDGVSLIADGRRYNEV